MKVDMNEAQSEFLKTEFFIFSWKAATEHNLVWNKNTTDKAKGIFRKEIKKFLVAKLLKEYGERKVTEEEHITNIEELQSVSENLGKGLLIGDCLNFGTCQKLLNMMCKYYWCVGFIEEPPHLPIDSINLKNAGIQDKCWTKDINDKNDYKEIIDVIRKKTGSLSLSEWEIVNWKRRNS